MEARIIDKNLRIQIIDLLLSALDPVDKYEKLILLSFEGAKIAEEYGQKDLQAYFMSRRASFLITKISFLQYKQRNLKLAPGWIEFSTKIDKNEYGKLTTEIEKIEIEIEDLLEQASVLAKESGNKKVLGRVLMEISSIESTRYLHYKSECFNNRFRTKLWLTFEILRHPFFEYLIIFSKKESKKLQSFINVFTENSLQAAQIFEELNDPTAGYAYHNLANNLKSTYEFKKAKKYLKKAKIIANKYGDKLLNQRINDLEKEIKNKNRDIPDYINGERKRKQK